jgi:glyoxylase-like metal-dependent hydrolase (beta-lactamase superfamily II)/ferredoxin
MANLELRVPENVPGDFFVDSTCIDCDACRQIAPAVFGEAGDYSFVREQPSTHADRRAALHALISCPTGSIGCQGGEDPKTALGDFPLVVEGPVSYCGFNSRKSYGGNSYFIRHPDGNWLVDSPKFVPSLVRQLKALGGVSRIFLTHRDDVADAEKYAREFAASRIIHRDELSSQPDAEMVIAGDEPQELAPGFLAIPTPGHTRGHCVLLYDGRFLFTGDHLAWNRDEEQLEAYHDYCWYSWREQTASMARLAEFPFEWVLPGHGQRVRLPFAAMSQQMHALVVRMQSHAD